MTPCEQKNCAFNFPFGLFRSRSRYSSWTLLSFGNPVICLDQSNNLFYIRVFFRKKTNVVLIRFVHFTYLVADETKREQSRNLPETIFQGQQKSRRWFLLSTLERFSDVSKR